MNRYITPRLAGIAALVKPGASVVDVGSDHAYVPIYLLKEKKAICALATDVHDGPLRRSQKNIAQFGFSDTIKTQKADGLRGVDITAYDTIIIAGMGGMLISEILENASSLAGKTLILQPMTAAPELRQYLLQNGYKIIQERIIQEDEKLYVILEAVCGQEDMYSAAELLMGRKSRTEPLYSLLKAQTEEKLRKRLRGLKAAKVRKEKEITAIETILRELSK